MLMNKMIFGVAAASLLVVGNGAFAEPPAYVARAIADPARAEDAGADARRHPAELTVFATVKPGDTMVDLVPGGGYFTRIFSQIVGPTGHVFAVWPKEYARIDGGEVVETQAIAHDPHYANVTILMEPAASFSIPAKADVVWTSQNYHDFPDRFMGSVNTRLLDKSIFQALKPGGAFIVTDHVAQPGSGLRDTEATHRIDPELVKAEVTSVGFAFDGELGVLRNPADTHQLNVFSPAIRGQTDQFIYRFRKARN